MILDILTWKKREKEYDAFLRFSFLILIALACLREIGPINADLDENDLSNMAISIDTII